MMKKIEQVKKIKNEENILLNLSKYLLEEGDITQEEQFQMEEKIRKESK